MHPSRTPLPIRNASMIDAFTQITALWSILYCNCNNPTICYEKPSSNIGLISNSYT